MRQHAFEIDRHGLTLRGTAYRPAGGDMQRHPAVLMLHGFTGQRMEAGFMFVRLARALAQRGIAAVTFDFLHSGESDGSFDQMLVTGELEDALRVTQWMQGQLFVDRARTALLGFSLGGLLAACAGARVSEYRALVLLAPTTVENLSRYAGEKPGEPVTIGAHTLHPRFFDDLRTLDPIADVVRRPRPTLLVQGTGDTAVPPAVSQRYADALRDAGAPAEVELIEQADHAFGRPPFQRRMIETVTAWLAARLGA